MYFFKKKFFVLILCIDECVWKFSWLLIMKFINEKKNIGMEQVESVIVEVDFYMRF
jgi:hypothetical protein